MLVIVHFLKKQLLFILNEKEKRLEIVTSDKYNNYVLLKKKMKQMNKLSCLCVSRGNVLWIERSMARLGPGSLAWS